MKTKVTSQAKSSGRAVHESDHDYTAFESLIRERVQTAQGPFFQTEAQNLFETYLAQLPAKSRQHYNCHCCRRFLNKYGGLVTLDAEGQPAPLLWPGSPQGIPKLFQKAAVALHDEVYVARVSGVFLDKAPTWGTPRTDCWTHLAGASPSVFQHALLTPSRAMAAKKEDFITLKHGLSDFPQEAIVQAVRVLEADAVDRSEKTLGVAKWLLALQESISKLGGHRSKNARRENLIWRAVATAPPGWCHIRSTMIATLLEDVIAGLPFESIQKRWNDKMHPLQYQRPTALKEGNVLEANKIVAKLGSEGALQRRFAKLSDILAPLWQPRVAAPLPERTDPLGHAFDHLLKQPKIKTVELPAQKMSWDKFQSEILPEACKIDCQVPAHGGFYGLVTAAHPEAPPLLQWDGLAGHPRNPVSWYFYMNGSSAPQWNLYAGTWVAVPCIHLKPCYWQKPEQFSQQGPAVFFTLSGAKDTGHVAGGGFFPETLRSEYHGIRAAMEAHAQSAKIEGREDGDANGIALEHAPLRLRVQDGSGRAQEYLLSL